MVEEIKVGDNDLLSAYLARASRADLLIILSDIDGLYTGDPKKSKHVKLLHEVKSFTPQLERLGGRASSQGFGGMKTKIQAARIACEAGIPVIVAKAEERDVLRRLLGGEEVGTFFVPRGWR